MMNDSHQILDDLLRQWHAHCKGYSPIPVAGADPMFRNAKAGRGYDTTAEIIEDELHGSTMETIDFQVDQMQDPWRAAIQAGHYRSRGAAKNLALDPRNIHGQCVQCNLHRHGSGIDFRLGLIGRYGPEFVEAIEADNAPRHNSIDDLKAIRADALAKTKKLKEKAE